MSTIPLLSHDSPQAIFAWRGAMPVTAQQFLADARALAATLPAARHALNACVDRYRFAVGLAACLIAGKTSLLPPTQAPEVIAKLKLFAPDAFCLADSVACDIDLPRFMVPQQSAVPGDGFDVPRIDGDFVAAQVFTSGSTGVPVPHAKTWSYLVADVGVEATRMGLDDGRRWAIVATVPPQHMYGFESSLLVAWHSGQSFFAGRPFYPADIVAALAAVPRARVLVSTPAHLRAILAADIALPEIDLVLCATAPLDAALAVEVEARTGARILEIYGSTETGQIASRHPTSGAEWQLWPGVELGEHEGRFHAQGGHLPAPTPLGDLLDILPGGRFLLRGRTDDMINIAGKRSSLAFLNRQLLAIPGVQDGAFFLPDEVSERSTTGTARLAAAVVAPQLTADAILQALRGSIDPVFLPRPLLHVEHLPRNSTGKLPRAEMQALLRRVPASPDREGGA